MKAQKGFGAAEYIVGLTLLVIVLLTPYEGGKNVIQMLSEGIKSHHAGYIHAQSRSHLQIGIEDF